MNKKPKIAVIGAGLAGVSLATQLSEFAEITVYEKSRGAGGRMSVRRSNSLSFDHGAQFFTARSEPFQRVVNDALAANAIVQWTPKITNLELHEKPFKREWFEPHYRGSNGMNSLAKFMAADLNINPGIRVDHLNHEANSWFLIGEEGQPIGPFDWVISAVPAPQALDLIPDTFVEKGKIENTEFSSCFALMLGFDIPLSLNFESAVIKHPVLAWMSVHDNSLLIHSRNDWASQNIDQKPDWVEAEMKDAVIELLPELAVGSYVAHQVLHRWKFARCERALDQDYLLDGANHLAAIGDWCRGNRVEDAFLSGYMLAEKLKTLFKNC